MILFPIHHIFVYISFNLWTFAFFFPHTFGFQWPRLLHRFDCVVCNLKILYYRRGSSQDIRDRSPDHGTMGRKQRFVWLYFCYCMAFYSYSLLRNDDSTSWKDFYDNFTVVCVSFSYSKRIQGLNHRCTSAVKSKFIACPSCWSHFLDNHLYGYIYILLYLCILLLEIINKKKIIACVQYIWFEKCIHLRKTILFKFTNSFKGSRDQGLNARRTRFVDMPKCTLRYSLYLSLSPTLKL